MSASPDATAGALYLGIIFATVLYGVSCSQLWLYFNCYVNDMRSTKMLVASIFLLSTIHQAFITHAYYLYSVEYRSSSNPVDVIWSLEIQVLINDLTAFLVQSYYAQRIWRLSGHNVWLTSTIIMLVLAKLASGVAYTVKTYVHNTLNVQSFAVSDSVLAAALDILLAVSLCVLLHRSRSGFKRSENTINRLIMLSLNTMLLTSLCAIGVLVAVLASPDTLITQVFCLIQGRLYVNSLLATLNIRNALRASLYDVTEDLSPSSIQFQNRLTKPPKAYKGLPERPVGMSVTVTTIHEQTYDHVSGYMPQFQTL